MHEDPAPVDSARGTDAGAHRRSCAPQGRTRCARSAHLLPVTMTATIPMASVHIKPWGIQVAGNFRRSAAVRQWQRIQARYGPLFGDNEAVVSRVRSPLGRRGIYAVRIGIDNRANADIICQQLRGAGGACIVVRNR